MEQLPTTMDILQDLERWGKLAKEAGVLPPSLTIPQAMVIIQAGREMGLQPLQSLRLISFVRGRLVMAVQLQLALARQRADVHLVRLEEDDQQCTVELQREGESVSCSFSMADAERAGLLREGGAWQYYPRQMLRWRAIGDALRIIAPDIVLGMVSPDELAAESEPVRGYDEMFGEANGTELSLSPSAENATMDRNRAIGKIHQLAKWLGWKEDTYRQWLTNEFGVKSSKELNDEQLQEAVAKIRSILYQGIATHLGKLHKAWGDPVFVRTFIRAVRARDKSANPLDIALSHDDARDLLWWHWWRLTPEERKASGRTFNQLTPDDALLLFQSAAGAADHSENQPILQPVHEELRGESTDVWHTTIT